MDTNQSGEEHKKQVLSEFADNRPRDEHGHFIPTEGPNKDVPDTKPSVPITDVIKSQIKIEETKDDDTLVDVHISNPLKRIQELLEDIKKQKAFTFSIKGSLGLAGIILVLTTFGIFGGSKAFCEKGIQTQTGSVRALDMTEEATDPNLPLWQKIINFILPSPKTQTNRIVLFPSTGSPIHLVSGYSSQLQKLDGQNIIVTGTFDACSQTLSINDPQAIQPQFSAL